jgi:2-oxoglutarate dehydrogenase E1 component
MERFLQLAAEGNIRVANLTTPSQYFHLLRRQARVAKQRPLVIMTPKSLLRLPQATSRIDHLADGASSRSCPSRVDEDKVQRLVLCTGKLYYDLKGHATRENNEGVAITRVELFYPFRQSQIMEEVKRYPNLREVVGAGGAAQHGRLRAHVAAPAADPAVARVRLHRPAGARLAGRGLPGRAHGRAEPDHPHRAGSRGPGFGQSQEAAAGRR